MNLFLNGRGRVWERQEPIRLCLALFVFCLPSLYKYKPESLVSIAWKKVLVDNNGVTIESQVFTYKHLAVHNGWLLNLAPFFWLKVYLRAMLEQLFFCQGVSQKVTLSAQRGKKGSTNEWLRSDPHHFQSLMGSITPPSLLCSAHVHRYWSLFSNLLPPSLSFFSVAFSRTDPAPPPKGTTFMDGP